MKDILVEARYLDTVPSFNKGKLVLSHASGYAIRKTRYKTYLVFAFPWGRASALNYAECVLEILSATDNLFIEGFDFNTFFSSPFPRKGEILDITFSHHWPIRYRGL